MNLSPFCYYMICKKIKSIPWCLSIKNKKGRQEYYKQYSVDGIRHQEYIRKVDVPAILQEYRRKQICIEKRREMGRIIKQMDKKLRREFRNQLRFFSEIEAAEGRINESLKKQTIYSSQSPKNPRNTPITLNETIWDSKSEVLCYNLAIQAGLHPVHNTRIYTDFEFSDAYRTVDLSFWIYQDQHGIPVNDPQKAVHKYQIFHEHMGMLENNSYRQKQLIKLKEYRQNDIYCGHNLIITTPYSATSELALLRQYVIGKVISGTTALRLLRKAKKKG